MKGRCLNPDYHNWSDYGGRGIRVCRAWIESFEAFTDHVGLRPSPAHSLGRIDNDGHYEPRNVRWETTTQQARNRRGNRLVTLGGETCTIAEWSERTGIGRTTITARLNRGWKPERVLSESPAPRLLEHQGQLKTVTEWSQALGISRDMLRGRLRAGWPVGDALTRPSNRGNPSLSPRRTRGSR